MTHEQHSPRKNDPLAAGLATGGKQREPAIRQQGASLPANGAIGNGLLAAGLAPRWERSAHACALLIVFLFAVPAAPCFPADSVTLSVDDPSGAAARVAAPVSVPIDLKAEFGREVDPARLELIEVTPGTDRGSLAVPVQFEPASQRRPLGTLWWLMPPAEEKTDGLRTFRLMEAGKPKPPVVEADYKEAAKAVAVSEHDRPVLRYAHGMVAVPEGTRPHFSEGQTYERGDYVSKLFGPAGQLLTDDFPDDHPHHRGLWWSWPVTRWGDEVADIWALNGVRAHPKAMLRTLSGAVLSVIDAESLWKWADTEPIVLEEVTIRTFRQVSGDRFLDIELRLTALVEGVAIGGRPKAGYGGFSLRAAPTEKQEIEMHVDLPDAGKRRLQRSWLDYSGVFAGADAVAGVTLLEHPGNTKYPNELKKYPRLNCVMVAFPGIEEYRLPKGVGMAMNYRVWIHEGRADEARLKQVATAYASPPKVTIEGKR